MSTAQDLMIVALDVTPVLPVEQGELSLALAGAELIDLVTAGAVTLDDDRVVPGTLTAPDEFLLAQAESTLVRVAPYERAEDWLWRRGRGLSAAYTARMEEEGLLVRPRGRLLGARSGQTVPADSAVRTRATRRWESDEPVLAALAAAVGVREEPEGDGPDAFPDAVATVLASVGGAVTELAAVRQRRSVEDAAFDNVWRGF